VPLRPGTEAALALGMAYVIVNSGLHNQEFVENYCYGFEDFEDEDGVTHSGFRSLLMEHYTLEKVSSITGVTTDVIARLAGEFATNHPAVAVVPTEVGGLANGNSLYTAMAVHALNALVGSIDVKGGVLVQRFPELTPWPEVESDRANRRGLAQPRIDGAGRDEIPLAYSAYQQVAENILDAEPYAINAVILVDTNPVYEVPNQGQFASALMKVPFVVSLTTVPNQSSSHADLILPISTFLEEWSDEFMEGTGYPGVSLRRPVVDRVHDSRGVGDILLQLAQLIGGPVEAALPFNGYKALVEYRLGAIDTDWDTFLENGNWSEMVYYNAAPGSTAWDDVVGRDRFNAPRDGRFDFFSRELYHLLQPDDDQVCLPHFALPANLEQAGENFQEYPFMLISQSLITQAQSWPGILPSIQDCYGLQGNVKWSSWVEISPLAAEEMGVIDGDMVLVESPYGSVQVPARVYEGLWPNAVFMPGGMGHLTSVNWGREEAAPNFIGENPRQLVRMGTESVSGCAIFSPQRVRISKA
jgi:anaerobic selenocysteine-containing dehydrogenase